MSKSYLVVSRNRGQREWSVEDSDIGRRLDAIRLARHCAKQAPDKSVQVWVEITVTEVDKIIQ